MKVLVTGGCGFIGSNLVRLLIEKKSLSVVNVDKLTYAGNADSLADLQDHPGYAFEQADICDADSMRRVFQKYQPQWVMHLAAESHVDRSIDGPGEFINTNVLGTYTLLQAALEYWRSLRMNDAPFSMGHDPDGDHPSKQTFRFHHISTDEVYGSLSTDAPAFSETTPYDPHSPYSASKASSDHLVRAWHDTYGLPVVITNCSNNYGPYQFPEKLIPVVILKCLRGEPVPVYGKGENIRDWLYVTDHAEALHAVVSRGRVGETYNVGGNNERKNIELVRMLCRIMDEEAPVSEAVWTQPSVQNYEDLITFVKDRPGHDMRYAINASKIHNELGWEPREDFESGFRKTVRWYLHNRDWWERILSGDYKLERQGTGARGQEAGARGQVAGGR